MWLSKILSFGLYMKKTKEFWKGVLMNYLGERKLVGGRHMQRSYVKSKSKVSQLKIKKKIYQTIEDLIILFIKLQFFNQVYQAFKPLHISISNLNLNLSLELTALSLVSSLIYCNNLVTWPGNLTRYTTSSEQFHKVMNSAHRIDATTLRPRPKPPTG